jgi:two-component system cell cycle sensor histidine kinase/response regulator CckA
VGTSFVIYLPTSNSLAHPARLRHKPQEANLKGVETILLVDDEVSLRKVVSKSLIRNGYQVLQADTGEDALGIYRQNNKGIDLVIMDLGMPGMGGKACLEQIRTLNPGAKVLIASGYIQYEYSDELLDLGAAGMLSKPYRKAELLRVIRKVLDS